MYAPLCWQVNRTSARRRGILHTNTPSLPRNLFFCMQMAGLPFGGDAQAVTRKLLERNIYFVAGREAPGQQASLHLAAFGPWGASSMPWWRPVLNAIISTLPGYFLSGKPVLGMWSKAIYFFEMSVLFETAELNTYV